MRLVGVGLLLAACGSQASTPVIADRDWRCFVVDPKVRYVGGRGHATHLAQRLYDDRLVVREAGEDATGHSSNQTVYIKTGDHFEPQDERWPPSQITLQTADGTRWTRRVMPWKDTSRHTDIETRIDATGLTLTQRNEQGVVDFDDRYVPAPCTVVDAEIEKYRQPAEKR